MDLLQNKRKWDTCEGEHSVSPPLGMHCVPGMQLDLPIWLCLKLKRSMNSTPQPVSGLVCVPEKV